MSMESQINDLANFIMSSVEGELSKSEGACVTAERVIKHLRIELDYLKKEVIDLRFLSENCIDKISIVSQIREKTDLAAKLDYELQALKGE